MTIEEFQQLIARGAPLRGEEMIDFMRAQSEISRRLQFRLNSKQRTPEEEQKHRRLRLLTSISPPFNQKFKLVRSATFAALLT